MHALHWHVTHVHAGDLQGYPPVTKVPTVYICDCHLSCLLVCLPHYDVEHFLVLGVQPKWLKQQLAFSAERANESK